MLMAYPSNTGRQVVPLSRERQTPPPAVPTHSVLRSPETPSMQLMRPLITPGPSARARRPSNVSESSFQPSDPLAGLAVCAAAEQASASDIRQPANRRAHARAACDLGMAGLPFECG